MADNNDAPVVRCTEPGCEATWPFPDHITYDELRRQGVAVRRIHGKMGVGGRCPEHNRVGA